MMSVRAVLFVLLVYVLICVSSCILIIQRRISNIVCLEMLASHEICAKLTVVYLFCFPILFSIVLFYFILDCVVVVFVVVAAAGSIICIWKSSWSRRESDIVISLLKKRTTKWLHFTKSSSFCLRCDRISFAWEPVRIYEFDVICACFLYLCYVYSFLSLFFGLKKLVKYCFLISLIQNR